MTPPQPPASRELWRYPKVNLVVTTAGLILALVLVTASMLFASYHDTLNAEKTSLRNVAIAFAAQTMSVAKAVDGTMTRAAGIYRDRGAADVGQVLLGESSGGALEYLRRLAIVDAAGRVVSSVSLEADGGPPLPPLPMLNALPRAPGGGEGPRIFVSHIDPRTGAELINFARPLAGSGGAGTDVAGGWIVAQVDAERFARLYGLVELGVGGSVTLFQRDGTMLVRGPGYPPGIGRKYLQTPLFREHLPRAERGAFETDSPLDGTPRLYGYDTVPGFPLFIITGMDRSDALAPWYGRLWMALAFNVLLAAVLSLVAWRVARGARRQFQLIDLLSSSQARLAKSSDYLASIINAVGAPIWVLDAEQRIVMANHAFARLVGRSGSELAGVDEQAVFRTQDQDRSSHYQALLEDGASVETVGPMLGRGGDGKLETRTVIQLTTRLVAESGETQLVSVLTDITERERAEARLAWLGEFDGVTSLPNQAQFWRLLEARLAAAAVSGRAQAVLALSLERLHEIVDLLGHDAGDRALRQIGDLLRQLAGDRAADNVVLARIRGAEFGVLVDAGSGRGAVERFALELHERCSAPLLLDGREFFLGPALGVALFPQDGSSADALYRCAQGARSGHGVELGEAVHFFSARVHLDLDQRLTVEAQLRRALAQGKLRLVFQPKATVQGARVVGFEALLRWSNPLLGNVSPVQCIPIAERTGLIIPIGNWVLEEACRRVGDWSRATGQCVKVAVNLSPRQFYQKSLLATIRRCLNEYGVPPGCLEIEITETALMSREDEVDRLMHDIRALGVELAIDDFGTGYSSLAYLKRFPVASLKVDRAFVRDLGKDEDSAAIARSIINLAHGLKLKVVAEGVETEAQLAILRGMDCDEYQGFLFSRPVEQDAVLELLRRHPAKGAAMPWQRQGTTAGERGQTRHTRWEAAMRHLAWSVHITLAALMVPAAAGDDAPPPPGLVWQEPTALAAGRGERGPWQQNDSRYDYVDDATVAFDAAGGLAVAWVDQKRKDVFVQKVNPAGGRLAGTPQNVSRSPATFSWHPRIAMAPGERGRPGTLYMLWQEIIFSGGSHGGDILFARSSDGGLQFSEPVNLSRSRGGDGKGRLSCTVWSNGSHDLAVAANGDVLATWTEYHGALWFARSRDGGASFTAPRKVAGDAARPARAPALATGPDGAVHLAWTVGEDPAADIHLARSDDDGASFGPARRVGAGPGHADAPRLAVDGKGDLHLVYAEAPAGPGGRSEIRHARSTGGGPFSAPRTISSPVSGTGTASAAYPGIGTDGQSRMVVIWEVLDAPGARPRALQIAVSPDGAQGFSRPAPVPGSAAPPGAGNGSHQGLLGKKLAVDGSGNLAIVNSSMLPGVNSRVWLMRGRSVR
ncbi:EAL domain-containing protein [Massilia niabensis]|uniref:EAL domain-containing protein n=1 Tax=Massilia niabensis TaxID=544910 RepID=A0ABW0LEH7_9BURK